MKIGMRMMQFTNGVEGVRVRMVLNLFCNDVCADSSDVMAVTAVERLVLYVQWQSTAGIVCRVTDQCTTNFGTVEIYVD